MREKPNVPDDKMAAFLLDRYGIVATELEFLPIGNDSTAWVYRVGSDDGTNLFLKVRKGPVHEMSLVVPRFLKDSGMTQVVAPIPPIEGERLWGTVDDYTLILYPFIVAHSAKEIGLSDRQWVEYGAIFRKLHAARLSDELLREVPRDTFVSSWCQGVQRLQTAIPALDDPDPRSRELVAIWTTQLDRISRIVERMEDLGRSLRSRKFELVLCHTDLHLNNVLVDPEGRLFAVDWDAPLLAPKERDLHFVIASKIGVAIGPREEALIFQGYGPTTVDWPALVYYRYEWICGDLLDYGEVALGTRDSGDAARDDAIQRTRTMFEPGKAVASADDLERRWRDARTCPAPPQTVD